MSDKESSLSRQSCLLLLNRWAVLLYRAKKHEGGGDRVRHSPSTLICPSHLKLFVPTDGRSTATHRTVPYLTVPYRTAPCHTAPNGTVPHRAAPPCTAPHPTIKNFQASTYNRPREVALKTHLTAASPSKAGRCKHTTYTLLRSDCRIPMILL